MSSGIFGYVNVLKSAADASWLGKRSYQTILLMLIRLITKDRMLNLRHILIQQ